MLILRPPIDLVIPVLAVLQPGLDAPSVITAGSVNNSDVPTPAVRASNEMFGDAVDAWRRRSGIARPRSAASASITAALVARSLLAAGQWNPDRVAVVTASTSSAVWTAVRFEMRGLTEGWHAVDPLLLPNTLPSALPTQIAIAIGAKALSLACAGGVLGVFNAIEIAALTLLREDADAVLVISAEEQTRVQRDAHERLGWTPVPGEFAIGVAAVRGGHGMRLGFIAYGDPRDNVVPDDWSAAPCFTVADEHGTSSIESVRTLMTALTASHDRVVVAGTDPKLGAASIGFERVH